MAARTWKLAQAAQPGHETTTQPGVEAQPDIVTPPAGTDAGHGAIPQGAAEQAAHGGQHGGTGIDPMHQFEIKRFIDLRDHGLDFLSFTNSALFMLIAIGLITIFFVYAMRGHSLVPNRLQSTAELAYEFVAKMVHENTGREGMQFFPFVFTLFIFILTLNMLGMVPYSFTVTSHIIVTFSLALIVFFLVTIVGFIRNGPGFLKLFVPSGVPMIMLPMITVLKAFSFLIRPISLSVRLFANMMAGHMMLKVFAAFVVALGAIGGWAPLAFMVAFTGLEILVAFLQAFVFAVLTCIYLNDALHMHH